MGVLLLFGALVFKMALLDLAAIRWGCNQSKTDPAGDAELAILLTYKP